jgi:hypothetical protein
MNVIQRYLEKTQSLKVERLSKMLDDLFGPTLYDPPRTNPNVLDIDTTWRRPHTGPNVVPVPLGGQVVNHDIQWIHQPGDNVNPTRNTNWL